LVESAVASQVAIGACLNCRQLFLITPDTPTCYLCGRPPAYGLAFAAVVSSAHPGPVEGPAISPPAAPPILIGVTCPHCQHNVQLSISDSEISVLLPPAPEPEDEEPEPDLTPPLAPELGSAEDRTTVASP
jgi:hypothetical protein